MPYKSDAQRRFFHSAGAAAAGISKATVAEFDAASKGMKLPERASHDHLAGLPDHVHASHARTGKASCCK